VKSRFEKNGVVSIVRVSIEGDIDMGKVMDMFSIGELVKVKCRLGFSKKNCCLSLPVEEVDVIRNVRLVIN
jgi:hypothetical protein